MSEVTNGAPPAETPDRQPAPSPAHIHIPAGTWALIVTDGDGNQLTVNHGDTVEGPKDLTISLAIPD
jgi:hypothetical protein